MTVPASVNAIQAGIKGADRVAGIVPHIHGPKGIINLMDERSPANDNFAHVTPMTIRLSSRMGHSMLVDEAYARSSEYGDLQTGAGHDDYQQAALSKPPAGVSAGAGPHHNQYGINGNTKS